MIPMLMYAQDEIGTVTPELMEEVARRIGQSRLAGGRSHDLLLHAAWQAVGQVPCPDLHQHQLLADRRRRALGPGLPEVWASDIRKYQADGLISLEEVECIGACSWAPAIQINYDFHHKVTPEKLDEIISSIV